MAMTRTCDDCGEPIDETVEFFTAQVQRAQEIDGVVTVAEGRQMDWHAEHIPTGANPAREATSG